MKIKLLFGTALLATSIAFAVEMSSAAKALVKLDEEWSAVAGTKDAAKVASYYAEEIVVHPPGMPAVAGREAASKFMAELMANPSFVTISWKPARADIAASGDLGVTHGNYEAIFKLPDGKTVPEKGKFLCVWKKQKDGSWKVIHDMWSPDSK